MAKKQKQHKKQNRLFNCGDFAIVKVVEFDNFKNR